MIMNITDYEVDGKIYVVTNAPWGNELDKVKSITEVVIGNGLTSIVTITFKK